MAEWGAHSGRKAPNPPDWQRRRRAVFERDDWTCVDCGWRDPTGATLECDHLGAANDHRIEHLATRCGVRSPRNCHGKRTSAAGHLARRLIEGERRRPVEVHPGLRPPAR